MRVMLREKLKKHFPLQQTADYLGVRYPRAYDIVVHLKQIPYIEHGLGGRSSPRYLVLKADVRRYRRHKRAPKGRPRNGDRKGKLASILSMASAVQEYRKKHGHYPDFSDENTN